MNESPRTLMQMVYETGFAVDDMVLYLDTHPCDANALNYYQQVVKMYREAVEAYECKCGPLTVEAVNSVNSWTWLTDKWPWEGEM